MIMKDVGDPLWVADNMRKIHQIILFLSDLYFIVLNFYFFEYDHEVCRRAFMGRRQHEKNEFEMTWIYGSALVIFKALEKI